VVGLCDSVVVAVEPTSKRLREEVDEETGEGDGDYQKQVQEENEGELLLSHLGRSRGRGHDTRDSALKNVVNFVVTKYKNCR
jgi:hypothetical protein